MYLIRQGNAWSVKVTIPKELRHIFGKVAFKQSLRTSNKLEANARAAPLIIHFKQQIEQARENPSIALRDNLSDLKAQLGKIRSQISEASSKVTNGRHLEDLKETQYVLESVLGDTLLASEGVEDSSELTGQALDNLSETFGIITGTIVPTLDHLESFLVAQAVEPSTARRYHQMIHRFSEKHSVASNVTAKDAREYIRHLSEDCGLTPRTVRSHLLPLRTYWSWMLDNEILSTSNVNPFFNVKAPKLSSKDAAKEVRFPYEIEDIQTLHAAIFRGNDAMLKALFAFGIYTGARREEITQLKLSDVSRDQVKIRAAKTRAGNRSVPIHPLLQPIINDLLESHPNKAADEYLLFDLTANRYGKRSVQVGKRFSRVKSKLGFDDRHDFHSIRKTVSTQLERLNVSEGISADILGHEKKTMTYGLYSGGSSMEQKAAAVNLIDYGLSKKS